MKLSVASVATVLALAGNVSAHYIFQQLTVGSTQYPVFQYIRRNSNFNHPVTDLTSNDLRCNVGATGAGTETVAVRAGDQITFTLDTAVYHQGPISVYMSKAPSTAASYAGDGGWFKIRDIGPTFSGGSVTWPLSLSYTFNLPTCITNGEYLLRIQNLGIHNPWPAGIPQFYISCAQISVSGGGSVNPTNTVLIPGAFKETDPGYTANIYSGLTSYTVPGPAVFSCSGSPPSSPPPTTSPPPTSPPPSTSPPTTPPPTVPPPTAPPPSAPCAALWGQCGGQGWSGATCCSAGTCKATNAFYSQCVN